VSGTTGKALVLFIIPILLYISLLPFMPLMEPDEGRYSMIPSSMNKSGDYVTPRLKEAIYLEKPPLAYWATALSFKIFGENEFSSRLFAGLCAWACILLVYSIGTVLQDCRTGLYGAAVLTISLFHFVIGRINILDMPLALFLSLATWSGYRRFSGTQKKEWLYLFYLFSALAFLTKGLIGIVFPGAIIVIWLIFVRRWREVYKLLSPLGIGIFLAVSLPWVLLVQKANPDFFRFFFIQEHFQRYTTTIHHRNEPFYYYIPIIILGTFPWSAFLFKALKGKGWGWIKERLFRKEETIFLLVWIGFITLFFSISSSKLIPYNASIFLPLSLFGGRIFQLYDGQNGDNVRETVFSRESLPVIIQSLLFITVLLVAPLVEKDHPVVIRWPLLVIPIVTQILLVFLPGLIRKKTGGNWFTTIYVIGAFFLAATIFPVSDFIAPHKSAYNLTQAIRKYVPAGRELYQYDLLLYGVDFYGKMRTPVVDDIGEVRYGSEFLPAAEKAHYFLNSEEFFRLAGKQREIYCATKGRERVERLRKEVSRLTVLWDNKYYYLLRLEGLVRK